MPTTKYKVRYNDCVRELTFGEEDLNHFIRACLHIRDAKTEGHVLTPAGELFFIAENARGAVRIAAKMGKEQDLAHLIAKLFPNNVELEIFI